MRRTILIFVMLALLLTTVSCGEDNIPTSDYYPHHCELALPLPHTFAQFETEEFDAAFTDGEAVAGMIRISFSVSEEMGIATTLEPRQFAQYYMLLSEREYEINTVGDVPYYSYESGGYFYTFSFYCSKYAYFIVTYSCVSDLRGEYEEKFKEYAKDAYFTM